MKFIHLLLSNLIDQNVQAMVQIYTYVVIISSKNLLVLHD